MRSKHCAFARELKLHRKLAAPNRLISNGVLPCTSIYRSRSNSIASRVVPNHFISPL